MESNHLSEKVVEALWPDISGEGVPYKTPDNNLGSDFIVEKSDATSISIRTTGQSIISIHRDSFVAAVQFLLKGGNLSSENAHPIGASIGDPGSLDMATRIHSGGTMVISYIVPILAATGIVGVSGDRPNKAWINP